MRSNQVKDLKPERVNQLWVSDLSYEGSIAALEMTLKVSDQFDQERPIILNLLAVQYVGRPHDQPCFCLNQCRKWVAGRHTIMVASSIAPDSSV